MVTMGNADWQRRQEADDEALARQLQAQEQQMVSMQPMSPAVQQGYQPGAVQGQPVQGTVIQGMAMPGQGTVLGQPYPGPVAYGMGGVPPMAYGQGMVVMDPMSGAAAVMQGPPLTEEELLVLNYRFSMTCFASIDAIFTSLNVTAAIRDLLFPVEAAVDRDENRNGLFGSEGSTQGDTNFLGFEVSPEVSKYIGLAGLIFLIGPICGLIGARTLKRGLVGVYFVFCAGKTTFKILMAVLTIHWWIIIVALIQVWITKIVFTFWKALGQVGEARLQQLMEPQIFQGAPVRRMYW
jgi:hypothetical protein